MRLVHARAFLYVFNCPIPLLLPSEALVLFLHPGGIPVMATVDATVAPTFTCCPPGRRCISLPRWSSCLMWTSSCRDTTQDTQMTSNGECHTHAHTHARVRSNPRALLPHVISCCHICTPGLSFFPCFIDCAARKGTMLLHWGVKIISWFIWIYFEAFKLSPSPSRHFIHISTERARGSLSPESFISWTRPSSLFTHSFWCVKVFNQFHVHFPNLPLPQPRCPPW